MRHDRRMASSINTRPHYARSAERDFLFAMASSFFTGSMLGALVVLMVMQ